MKKKMDSLTENIKLLLKLRMKKKKADDVLAGIKADISSIQGKIIEEMDTREMKSGRGTTFGLITKVVIVYANVKDFAKAKAYFEEEGVAEEMLTEKVQGVRLNIMVREMVANGEPVPEFFGWYPKVSLSVTSGGKKK